MPRKARATDPNAQTKVTPEPVRVFTPNPVAWTTALALADGDAKRLKALDESTVLVANNATARLMADL